MSETEKSAFNHAISRHGDDFGLSWGKKETLPDLTKDYNKRALEIRDQGTYEGIKKVPYGEKGKGEPGQMVDAYVYSYQRDGQTYYYYETKDGKFISAGLDKLGQ